MEPEATSNRRGVLIVDDDPDIREMLCELVQSESGCVAYPAEHGRQALEILASLPCPPCLILLDLSMPIMNGREVLEALSGDEIYGKIPLTVITASDDSDLTPTGGLLRKPFTVPDLRKLLHTYCCHADAQTAPPTLISKVASLLRDQKETLIREWTSRVRADPVIRPAHNLDEERLRNNVPRIVEALIASLQQSAQRTELKGASAQEIGGDEAARMHAQHRLQDGYTLGEELRELGHLRHVLVDVCTGAGLILKGAEANLVHGVVDAVMTTAALEMEKTTSEDLRRDIALRELFVAILGHDLRTPLTSIVLASSKLLLCDDFTEAVSKDLRRIAASAARMQSLIEDLLDMARVRNGGLPITRKPTDLRLLCEQVVDETRLIYPHCTLQLHSSASVSGEWDPERLTQLLQNLVGNAIEHGQPEAPIQVEVRDQGHAVEVEVHNEGLPISPEVLPSIFDAFIQGEPAARRMKGLGLGLFISKAITEAHHGSLRVRSEPDRGTSFIATLPRS
jgi:signal transduction histidine kinase